MVTTARKAQGGMKLSGSQRKTAHALRLNLETQILEDGLNQTGFLTLTVGDSKAGSFRQIKDSGEASKRIHGLLRRFMGRVFKRGAIVTERHRSGAIHFHLVGTVAGGHDIRTGLDFAAVAKGDYRTASPELRRIWKLLRDELPNYGFGRAELLPIKKTGAQVASYVAKYVEKNIGQRSEEDKGKKLVRYFGWNKRQLKPNDFGWATPRAGEWRTSARLLAGLVGVDQRAEAADCFGPRWAFRLTGVMNGIAGNDQVSCREQLADFRQRDTARSLTLRVANYGWVMSRQMRNRRDPRRRAAWEAHFKTPNETALL